MNCSSAARCGKHLLDHGELLEPGKPVLREEDLAHAATRQPLDEQIPPEHLWQPLDPAHGTGVRVFEGGLQRRHPIASRATYNDHFRPSGDPHVSLEAHVIRKVVREGVTLIASRDCG